MAGKELVQPPMDVILRHPDVTVREKIAELAEHAAANDHIGYDQDQRRTFWQQLKKSGYDPANITVDCEADCSAGVAGVVKATGYLLNDAALKNVSSDMYSGNEVSILTKAGFTALRDTKYLKNDKYLLRGDILLYENHHTAINLTDGEKAKSVPASHKTVKKGVTGADVALLQKYFTELGYTDRSGTALTLDGKCGTKTVYVIKRFQDEYDLSVDGSCGKKTWAVMDALMDGHAAYQVKVQTTLNLRKGPDKTFAKIRTLSAGEVYTVTRSKGAWLYLKEAAGWVSGAYTARV